MQALVSPVASKTLRALLDLVLDMDIYFAS